MSSFLKKFKCRPVTWVLVSILMLTTAVTEQLANAESQVYEGQGGWLFPEWESLTIFDKRGIDNDIVLLRKAKDLLAQRHIQLFILLVPSKAAFYETRLPPDHSIGADVRGRYRYILQQMQQAGLQAPDIWPALKAVEDDKKTAFYRTDYHWTAFGAEAAAQVMAQTILQSGIALSGHAGSGSKLGAWRNDRHYGDLAERYVSAERRATLGRDLFTVRDNVDTAASLIDDEPSPIRVIGNSFVQPYFGFSQKLSNLLDRPVSLSWSVGNIGPWMNTLKYLEAADFAAPQVLVWQMNEAQIQFAPNDPSVWDAASLLSADEWLRRVSKALQ